MLISNMLKFWLYVDFESSYERTQIMGRQFDAFDIVPQVIIIGSDTIGYHIKGNFMLISNMLKFWLYVDFESSYERTQIMGRQFDAFDIVPQVIIIGSNTIGYHIKGNFMLISNMLKFWLYVDFESSYERTQIMGRQFDAFDIVPQVIIIGSDTIGYHIKGNFMLISNMLKFWLYVDSESSLTLYLKF